MYIGLWIFILIALIIVEVATADTLVTIWFIPGAIASLIVAMFMDVSFLTQCIVFFIVSIIALAIFKPHAEKYLRGNIIATNADRVIGKHTKITKAIKLGELGEVRINGVTWNARTIDDSEIMVGTTVKVVAIDGSKLVVEEIRG